MNEDWVLVTNSAFYFNEGRASWGKGFVTLIARRTRKVVSRIPTTQENPGDIIIRDETAYVVNSGTTTIDSDGIVRVTGEGGIDIIDLHNAKLQPPLKPVDNIILSLSSEDNRIGAFGSIALSHNGHYAFIGSGTRGDLFSIDLGARRPIHGPDDPIELFFTPPDRNGLTRVRIDR